MAIYFYRESDRPYGCFSNFSAHGFRLEGLDWLTSEHYYQAHKFFGLPYFERVRSQPTPTAAATLGRDRALPVRSDWDQVKEGVMRRAVLCKFQTHAEIREILLGTGDEVLIEDSPVDYYWGCGADGSGKNRLGMILMEIRAVLRL